MCGIFAYYHENSTNFKNINNIKSLFKFSQKRGKDSSGLQLVSCSSNNCFKLNESASKLLSQKELKEIFNKKNIQLHYLPLLALGHTRMQTNGSKFDNNNNQPIIEDGYSLFHNGIVVNYEEIIEEFKFKLNTEVDSEVILKLYQYYFDDKDLNKTINNISTKIKGANSFILLDSKRKKLILYSRNGSFFYSFGKNIFYGTSEKSILQKILLKEHSKNTVTIKQLKNDFKVINLHDDLFFGDIQKIFFKKRNNFKNIAYQISEIDRHILSYKNEITRCSRCILPNTFPSISFNSENICNYCESHEKLSIQKVHDQKFVNNLGKKILVPFSGGRDSAYALNYLSENFDGEIISYTYDWGFVTKLARKNISRICGELKIENILVSADIDQKRKNARKNILAWIKKPDISMIPLFMAGDKSFFYFASEIFKEGNFDNLIFSMNPLEETKFKSLYAGATPLNHKYEVPFHRLNNFNMIKMISTYLKNFIKNPKYINSSLPDTFLGFIHYYLQKIDYKEIFKNISWDENIVEKVIRNKLGFEVYNYNLKSSWRVGDALSPLYNYIYFNYAGFTENDTFRSNQIRNGFLSRNEAIDLVFEENKFRLEPYLELMTYLNLDPIETLKEVNLFFNND